MLSFPTGSSSYTDFAMSQGTGGLFRKEMSIWARGYNFASIKGKGDCYFKIIGLSLNVYKAAVYVVSLLSDK